LCDPVALRLNKTKNCSLLAVMNNQAMHNLKVVKLAFQATPGNTPDSNLIKKAELTASYIFLYFHHLIKVWLPCLNLTHQHSRNYL